MGGAIEGRTTGFAGRAGGGVVVHAVSSSVARTVPAMVINRIWPLCGGQRPLARPGAGRVQQRKPIATRRRQR